NAILPCVQIQSPGHKLWIQKHNTGRCAILGILATEAAFSPSRVRLDTLRSHFQSQTKFLTELHAERLFGVTFHPPKASFLAWLDFQKTDLAEQPADFFLRKAHVALSPGNSVGVVGVSRVHTLLGEPQRNDSNELSWPWARPD